MPICKTKTIPKAANIRKIGMKKTFSPGRRMSVAGLVAEANVASRFNPKVSRKGDSTANRAGRVVDSKPVANIASRFNPRVRRRVDNMANRANRAAARVRAKERKAKRPQPHRRSN